MNQDQLLDQRSWLRDYEQVKQNILGKRARGTLCKSDDVRELSVHVSLLEKGLATMQAAPMSFEVTQAELSRRAVITENLRRQLSLLNIAGAPLVAGSSNSNSSSSSSSSSHQQSSAARISDAIPPSMVAAGGAGVGSHTHNNNSSSSSSSSSSGSSSSSEGYRTSFGTVTNPISLSSVSDRGLVQRQEEVMRQQDAMIDDIALGVDRLHQRALDINEEAKIHNKIISNLDVHVDSATTGLRQEARHIERVRVNSRMCCLYICVLSELIIVAVLLFVVYQYMGGFPKISTKNLRH